MMNDLDEPVNDVSAPPEDTASGLRDLDLANVPMEPGCYLMYGRSGTPIYVGKAKNLRARLRSYVTEQDTRYTVKFLLEHVVRVEFLITSNEKEALLLENSLIKQHKPRYNIRLRDDKTYMSLRLNPAEDFPRVTVVRRYTKDGARYFGPYSSSDAMRKTLHMVRKLFPLRVCADNVLHNRTRPCLYYQMQQCTAPCVGLISPEAYREIVQQVILVLEGRTEELERDLQNQIAAFAETLEFEKAALVRDRLFALRHTVERQRTVAVAGVEDRDVLGLYREGRFTEVQVLFFRGGKMTGGRDYLFEQNEAPLDELLSSFLLQYASQAPILPGEFLVSIELEDAEALSELLSEQRGATVTVHWPQRGEKRALIELATKNAQSSFREKRLAEEANRDLLEQLQHTLDLPMLPNRIECFDISTLQGTRSVGSMVVFEGGVPSKKRYRHFSIREVEGQDDFAMLREVLLRRYQRAIDEDDLPDLVLIDGGKGQLNVASTVLKDLAIEDLPVASIAKARAEEGGHSPERFFTPGRKNPIILPQHSAVVQFLARIRDEAHRFAITHHRKKRQKGTLRTSLIDIPGIGPKRAKLLLNRLGSLTRVREASPETIAALPGFNRTLAEDVLRHLAKQSGSEETAE